MNCDSNSDEDVFTEQGSFPSLPGDMPGAVSPAPPEIIPRARAVPSAPPEIMPRSVPPAPPESIPPQVMDSINQVHSSHVPLVVGIAREPQLESPAEDKDWYLVMDEIKSVQKSLEDLSSADYTPAEEAMVTESSKESTPSEIQSNGKPQSEPDISDDVMTEEKPVIYPRSKIRPIPKQRPFSSQGNIFPVVPSKDLVLAKRRSITVSGGGYVTSPPQKSPPIKPQPILPSSAPATSSPPASPDADQAKPSTPNQTRSTRLKSRDCKVNWTLAKASSHPSISEAVEVLTLTQLVEEQSKHFPMSVVAIKGLEGQVLFKSIINIHFLKITKVIDGSDAINERYLFPYNSSIRFGIVYCPGIKTESYIFEKVSDIIRSTDLPKVVTCTKKVKSKNAKLEVNEILIVQEIINPHQQKVSKKSQKLKVFSFTKKSEKILSGDLNGRFTTDPRQTALFLPDILNYIPTPFPVYARLFLDEEGSKGITLPDILIRETVQLMSSSVETSIVASCTLSATSTAKVGGGGGGGGSPNSSSASDGGGDGSGGGTVVEIPVNQDILVSLLSKEPQEKSDSLGALHARSHALLKDLFHTSTGKSVVLSRLMTSRANPFQHKLYAMTRKGWDREGQSVRTPRNLSSLPPTVSQIYQPLTDGLIDRASDYTPTFTSSVSSASDCWSTVEDSMEQEFVYDNNPFTSNHIKTPPASVSAASGNDDEDHTQQEYRANQRMVRRIEALELKITKAAPLEKMQRLTRRVEGLDSRLSMMAAPQVVSPATTSSSSKSSSSSKREQELEKEVESLRVAYKALKDEMKTMQSEMKEMTEKMKALPATIANVAAVHPHKYKQQSPEENIVELKELNEEQVGKLLEALGLHQHKPRFLQETITGEILAECNEEVLTQDLGIREKSQCTKVMELIRGKYSPLALMADYSYVRFKSSN